MMRDEMCCKSVGTDLSMLDIDDFITEISQLKKEVALLETKLRLRGDEGLKREDSELSLTLLCYTESKPTDAQDTTVCDSNQGLQDEESTDQTSTESLDSVWNAGEQQQILQTKLKMCSVKLEDCRNLMMKIKTEPTAEEDHTDEDKYCDDYCIHSGLFPVFFSIKGHGLKYFNLFLSLLHSPISCCQMFRTVFFYCSYYKIR
ncbi:uncharacterized protein [Paramisgurnus dabryanus]|uniref:uncharacterized protein n=1 Tax=Paramisgurnus dabryanus TaxID=90735 RepID=UPI0031F40041